jgi:hypothetical protein
MLLVQSARGAEEAKGGVPLDEGRETRYWVRTVCKPRFA